eukprot:m.47245 g.47245  ORF g.47245 m.47245 type:complete len:55 (-) comp47521_c0_seq5:149-313(-)
MFVCAFILSSTRMNEFYLNSSFRSACASNLSSSFFFGCRCSFVVASVLCCDPWH